MPHQSLHDAEQVSLLINLYNICCTFCNLWRVSAAAIGGFSAHRKLRSDANSQRSLEERPRHSILGSDGRQGHLLPKVTEKVTESLPKNGR